MGEVPQSDINPGHGQGVLWIEPRLVAARQEPYPMYYLSGSSIKFCGGFSGGGGLRRFWVAPNVMGAARLDAARRKESALNQATEDPVGEKTMPSSGLF